MTFDKRHGGPYDRGLLMFIGGVALALEEEKYA